MTPSPFRTYPFIETAFARRFQAMLRSAWHNRSWHVIVADPGAGKTTSIRDLQKRAGGRAILAVVTPKNNDDEQALGDQFLAALGVPIRGHWSTRKPKIMGHLHQSGTECLVVDDAHDLSMPHLMFLKEVTDQGRLQYDHPLGLCLVAAGRGNMIPRKRNLRSIGADLAAMASPTRSAATLLPGCRPHQRRNPRGARDAGNGVPATAAATEPSSVDRLDL